MTSHNHLNTEPRTVVTKEDIVRGLREIGIREGDLVQVHSSLKSFVYVEGGAEAVVDALLETVGSTLPDGRQAGTVMVPTFNHGSAEVFDIHETPSSNGIVTETLRRRPQAVRSMHPTHPYAAIGPAAPDLMRGHLHLRTFDIESPLGRLAQRGGWVLMLGAPLNTNTIAHVGETMANVHCLGYRQSQRKVRDEHGNIIEAWSDVWRDGKCRIEWDPLYERLRSRNMIRREKIGNADVYLMKGMDVINVTLELTKELCPTCPVQPKES